MNPLGKNTLRAALAPADALLHQLETDPSAVDRGTLRGLLLAEGLLAAHPRLRVVLKRSLEQRPGLRQALEPRLEGASLEDLLVLGAMAAILDLRSPDRSAPLREAIDDLELYPEKWQQLSPRAQAADVELDLPAHHPAQRILDAVADAAQSAAQPLPSPSPTPALLALRARVYPSLAARWAAAVRTSLTELASALDARATTPALATARDGDVVAAPPERRALAQTDSYEVNLVFAGPDELLVECFATEGRAALLPEGVVLLPTHEVLEPHPTELPGARSWRLPEPPLTETALSLRFDGPHSCDVDLK